ncbi:hypothetical protein ACXU4B_10650 [Dyella soli]|uniref:Secreted protein n=1 Tax=Dyella soli TaxID=522319 RepID=A0A4R0YR75_9GAMM|nr:hypothetical protein [Dyella soli]TCI07361.1 hypothetical protein EZM97_32775 [Dyella soli]
MKLRKVGLLSIACTAMLMSGLLSPNEAHAQPSLTQDDYAAMVTAILQKETAPDSGAWTIFVGVEDADANAMIPRLKVLYQDPTLLKAMGKDWGNGAQGCHIDKATGTGATGIFVSAPEWQNLDQVAFTVTFAACAIGTHINTYVFDHRRGTWVLRPVASGPMS